MESNQTYTTIQERWHAKLGSGVQFDSAQRKLKRIEKMESGLFPNFGRTFKFVIYWAVMAFLLWLVVNILGFAHDFLTGMGATISGGVELALIIVIMMFLGWGIRAWVYGANSTWGARKHYLRQFKKLDKTLESAMVFHPWKNETGLNAYQTGLVFGSEPPENSQGTFFEWQVYNAFDLHDEYSKNVCHTMLAHVYLPAGNNTTEIDVMMIDSSGLYVFECKSTPGAYFGHDTDEHWEYCIGQNTHTVYNPIRQNEGHIRAVNNILNGALQDGLIRVMPPIYNVVVVPDECNFAGVQMSKPNTYLVHENNADAFIRHMRQQQGYKLGGVDVQNLSDLFQSHRVKDQAVIAAHVTNIQMQQGKF